MTLNNPIEIEITCSHIESKSIAYQVIAKDGVILYRQGRWQKSQKITQTIQPQKAMAPVSHVIFYYVTSTDEIISDKVTFEFENDLPNEIDVQLSSLQSQPSGDLNISIGASPGSFIGLLGVDQSVLLLKSGNDINAKEVLKELETYNEVEKSGSRFAEKSYRDFESSNAVVITNAKKEHGTIERYPYFDDDYEFMLPSFRSGIRPISLNVADSLGVGYDLEEAYFPIPSMANTQMRPISQSHPVVPKSKPIEVRKVFPETWIFDSFVMPSRLVYFY